ncbi:hypothetical protein QR680_006874 [Steinernema hermaphroditum]|uniref:Uncharacterized protein n=1 Tax=Steinernema hermaphroditum TaxID=289476 RepID=A0AA39LXT6_9BILA|nr:hypothetical protein QR680_006874 [Steinernema hermaphroditum]
MQEQKSLTVEFEATVRYLASYLYGRIPRTISFHGFYALSSNLSCLNDSPFQATELMEFPKDQIISLFPNDLILYIKHDNVIAKFCAADVTKVVYPEEEKTPDLDILIDPCSEIEDVDDVQDMCSRWTTIAGAVSWTVPRVLRISRDLHSTGREDTVPYAFKI